MVSTASPLWGRNFRITWNGKWWFWTCWLFDGADEIKISFFTPLLLQDSHVHYRFIAISKVQTFFHRTCCTWKSYCENDQAVGRSLCTIFSCYSENFGAAIEFCNYLQSCPTVKTVMTYVTCILIESSGTWSVTNTIHDQPSTSYWSSVIYEN